MDIMVEANSILTIEGYECSLTNAADEQLYFEDESVLGFIATYPRIEDIFANWEERQDKFLRKHSSQLQSEPQKAWNVSSVFLTIDSCSEDNYSNVHKIEENFRGTRKIVGFDVQTRHELKQALLPLLKIQNIIVLKQEDYVNRLRREIEVPQILEEQNNETILRRLLEEK